MKEEQQSCGSMPPRWAEAVLRSLLRPNDRDIIAGDLIEEYREAVLPARGVVRAHIWYCRQVLSFLNAGLACQTISRWLSLFCVVAGFTVNAPVYTPAPLVAAFLIIVPLAGFQWAHRTGTILGGSAVALATAAAMFVVWTVLVAILHRHHPPFGTYLVPLACAIIIGTAGAAFGKRFTRKACCEVLSLQLS